MREMWSSRSSSGAPPPFLASYDVLVHIRLAVVGWSKGAEPGYREGVAKHHLHVHPFGPFGPASLLLLQLLDALKRWRWDEGWGLWDRTVFFPQYLWGSSFWMLWAEIRRTLNASRTWLQNRKEECSWQLLPFYKRAGQKQEVGQDGGWPAFRIYWGTGWAMDTTTGEDGGHWGETQVFEVWGHNATPAGKSGCAGGPEDQSTSNKRTGNNFCSHKHY